MKVIYSNTTPCSDLDMPGLAPHIDTLLRELRHVHPPKDTETFAHYLQSCMHPCLLTQAEKYSIVVACDMLDMLTPATTVFNKYLA